MHTTTSLTRDVRAELAHLTNTHAEDWFLVFRARHGLETVLAAMGAQKGSGEIITQPFTCATAVNPIMSAAHIPVYVDASYDDLSLDTSKLQANASTRAVVMQNTFSIECDMLRARAFADKHDLLLIEDSAHHVGMLAKKAGIPLADISVHSFGVEKLLPTKFGGAVWVNPAMKDGALGSAIRSALETLPVLDKKRTGLARRYRSFNRLLNHTPAFAEPSLRSFLIRTGLFQPAIMPSELAGNNYGTAARPDAYTAQAMLQALKSYSHVVAKRQHAAAVYKENLSHLFTLPKKIPENYAPTRFPLLCRDSDEAEQCFTVLRTAGHYSGKWYRPTLFPGVTDVAAYNYDPEECPVAEDSAARIVNLPTNISVSEAKEIAHVLQREITR